MFVKYYIGRMALNSYEELIGCIFQNVTHALLLEIYFFFNPDVRILYVTKVKPSVTTNCEAYLVICRLHCFHDVVNVAALFKLSLCKSFESPRVTPDLHYIYIAITLATNYSLVVELTETENPL